MALGSKENSVELPRPQSRANAKPNPVNNASRSVLGEKSLNSEHVSLRRLESHGSPQERKRPASRTSSVGADTDGAFQLGPKRARLRESIQLDYETDNDYDSNDNKGYQTDNDQTDEDEEDTDMLSKSIKPGKSHMQRPSTPFSDIHARRTISRQKGLYPRPKISEMIEYDFPTVSPSPLQAIHEDVLMDISLKQSPIPPPRYVPEFLDSFNLAMDSTPDLDIDDFSDDSICFGLKTPV